MVPDLSEVPVISRIKLTCLLKPVLTPQIIASAKPTSIISAPITVLCLRTNDLATAGVTPLRASSLW